MAKYTKNCHSNGVQRAATVVILRRPRVTTQNIQELELANNALIAGTRPAILSRLPVRRRVKRVDRMLLLLLLA